MADPKKVSNLPTAILEISLTANLTFKEVLALCSTNKQISQLCAKRSFWIRYFDSHPEQLSPAFWLALQESNLRILKLVTDHRSFDIATLKESGSDMPKSQYTLDIMLIEAFKSLKTGEIQEYIMDFGVKSLPPSIRAEFLYRLFKVLGEIHTEHAQMHLLQIPATNYDFGLINRPICFSRILNTEMKAVKTANLQQYILSLPADQFSPSPFFRKPSLMSRLFLDLNQLHDATVQKYLIDTPANEFDPRNPKSRRMSAILCNNIGSLHTARLQQYVIDLPAVLFDSTYTKAKCMRNLANKHLEELRSDKLKRYVLRVHRQSESIEQVT
jgi:plasmid maintenance system killer protein